MVSVVIALYNTAKLIGRCLDSVLGQTYSDIEIIVVDDCSTDGSAAVVEQYCERHSNIRLIRHDRNSGPMMARRDGYEAATGNFIMFVDSDDALPIDAVEGLIVCQQATDADIVIGNALKHNADGTTSVLTRCDFGGCKTDVLSAVIDNRVRPQLWCKLFKRSLFHGGSLKVFDGMTLAEDGCLLYQLMAKAETIVSYDGIVYDYYFRKDSLSRRAYGRKEVESIIIASKMMETAFGVYAELHDKLQRQLTFTAFRLYFEWAGIRAVRRLLRKHGMQRYGSLRYAGRYLGMRDYCYFAKHFVYVRTELRRYWHK